MTKFLGAFLFAVAVVVVGDLTAAYIVNNSRTVRRIVGTL